MAKRDSTLFNMVITLFVVTLLASTALGFVYEVTKEPIARAKLAKKTEAIKKVMPEFTNNPVEAMYKIPGPEGYDSLEIYPAENNTDQYLGAAVRTYSKKGYSGEIWLMVGFNPEGEIINIDVLEHKETPGLGTKMADAKFKDQYTGKHPGQFNLKVKKDGGEVDAITAATISSRAFSEAVQHAWEAYQKADKGGRNE
ncbi:MAG: RnfABCDGE type electron transport complex subunit G [Cyclobacteriaceae bacterium]